MSKLQIKVGDVLTIDGKPAKATVIEVGSVGCYILTEDNCKIPFFWTELEHRNVQIVGRSITQGDIVKFVQVFEAGSH